MSRTVVTETNKEAPVVGASQIEIAATPEAVWQVLTAVHLWPSWNPQIKEASLEGGLQKGSEFRWKTGPGMIVSTFADVDAPRRISCTGGSMGIKAIHVHSIEDREGRAVVKTEESYDGLVARLFQGRLQNVLDEALEGGLQHLEPEVEGKETGRED